MTKFPNMIKLLVVLAMVCSLVAIAAAPAYAAAGITPNISAGKVGTPVTITATGFTTDAYLTAKFDNVSVPTIPASVKVVAGSASFAINIPAHVAGTYNIEVTDGANTASTAFTVQSAVTVTSPATKLGVVGSPITVQGTGFNAGVTAFVVIEEAGVGNLTIGNGIVDSAGGVTVSGTVPPLTSGIHKVWGKDNAGSNSYAISANCDNFTVTPTIAVTPTSGLAGTTVTVSGTGWAAGNVTLSLAGAFWGNVTAAANGQIAQSLQVLSTAALGINQIVAQQGSHTTTTTFTVVARALTLTPSSGPRGTTVLITGSNFSTGPGHYIAIGGLTFGGLGWNASQITIDTGGVMSPTTLAVKSTYVLGANTVQAVDDMGLIATATFTIIKPTIAINPTTGPKGSTVTVTGSGWVPGATVTISLDGTAVQTVTPDSTGNIAATATIPTTAGSGPHTFTAADATTIGNSADAATFTVPGPSLSVTPNSGVATTTVTVSGAAFGAYFPITVKIGGYPVGTVISNALGGFSYTFNVPGLAPTTQVIEATDGTNSATTFFTITAAPISVDVQIAGISSVLVRIWGYFGGTWQMYDPADDAGSNLATLTAGRGYWVNVSEAGTLIFGAYSYDLSAGWNLIGWR